jgi:hypothetical protein
VKIPVIINNRDLLTWTKDMVSKIKTYDNVGEIIILDNASTYKPLIDWYKTNPCTIIYGENLGHTAPWQSGLVKKINAPYYVVTDPDLGINDTPKDTLDYLFDKLTTFNLPKVGLGLEWELTPEDSPYFEHIINYEKHRVLNSKVLDNVLLDVAVDTVFALYKHQDYFIGGASTGGVYRAKHYPWYLTVDERNKNTEFMYYIQNASNSSSYKTFLKL